jgi:mRNA interferase RelE/StbE
MKTIILTDKAAREFDNLDVKAREQVSEGLYQYAVGGQGDVKRLAGRDGFRLRIGRYRVIFDEDKTTILAVYVGKRETTTYRKN